jgi:hypothetical protein
MQQICHDDSRLADYLVKLDVDCARTFRRDRGEKFTCVDRFVWGDLSPADVIRRAIDSLNTAGDIDVILANQLSTVEATAKAFGTGWKIESDDSLITVFINDLFAQTAISLKIDTSVINDTAQVLSGLGLTSGRLFFACPSRDFRYAVFCSLGQIKSSLEILQDVQVRFSVALPVFQNIDGSFSDAAFEPLAPPAMSQPPAQPVDHDDEYDMTLCVLLDEKQETAIAAAAYLDQQAALRREIIEIGLWRKRFKSAFYHFGDVTEVYELNRLPLVSADRQDLSAFIGRFSKSARGLGPVVTIGQELIVVNLASDMYHLLAEQFARVRLVVVGHRDVALTSHWAALSGFINLAARSVVILGGEPSPAPKSLLRKGTDIKRFYLPPYLKQQILAAENNGSWSQKRLGLAAQILPDARP